MTAKVVVLGMDAASPVLLRRWAADGTLPTIRALMDRGLIATTRSLEGFFVGATWPSFYTGVSPARHGFNYLLQFKPGTYQLYEPARGDFVKARPFWDELSRAGRRVAILDVPLCRLDPRINGIHVIEWGGHDPSFGYQTWPGELADTIAANTGGYCANHTCDLDRRTPDDYRVLIDDLLLRTRLRGAMTIPLLRRERWDLFIQVFAESHCGGHQCWHLHDPGHPAHDPGQVAALGGDPLRRVYSAIDTAIGEILEEVGDAIVLVVSLHGMAHWYGAQFLLPEILFRLGVASPAPPAPARRALAASVAGGARWAWHHLPAALKSPLANVGRRLVGEPSPPPALPALGIDPRSSRCFPIPNGLASGGIRLNLKGREPAGLLAPGREADDFSAELEANLLEIVDERTGGRLVDRVLRTADLYSGGYLGDLPDLLVDWSDQAATGSTRVGGGAGAVVRAHSPRIGVVEGVNTYCRTGEHRMEGMLIAAGPGIKPGRIEGPVSVLDFAPTIGALLGVELRAGGGRVVAELAGPRDAG
ncbi:MAG: alkaline phosphatase family protein [Gemmatimonadales bacterium]